MRTTGQIEAAAEWWTARLRDCQHSGLSAQERLDPANRGYQFAEALMTMNRPTVTDEQVAAFHAALVQGLTAASIHEQSWIAVDYGPAPVLLNALTAAGIDGSRNVLPIKTHMRLLDDGTVSVSYGYGAEDKTIYEPTQTTDGT